MRAKMIKLQGQVQRAHRPERPHSNLLDYADRWLASLRAARLQFDGTASCSSSTSFRRLDGSS